VAVKTFYLTNSRVGTLGQQLSETSPGSDAYASPALGWVVGTGAGVDYSEFEAGAERASSTFGATVRPDGSLEVASFSDYWTSESALTGSFASGNWTINGVVRAQTLGGAQDGRLRYRLFRCSNSSGSAATEITGGVQIGATLTNVSTSADFNSSVTFNPGAFSLSSEFLMVQVAWERTGAGGMTSADINFRIGTNSTRVVTSDFSSSQSVTPTVAIATSAAATPTITLGAVNVTPTTAVATASAANAAATIVTNVTPTAATAQASASDATVALGAITATPTTAIATSAASDPTVTLGALNVTPTPAVATAVAADPTVDAGNGAQNITPTVAAATASAADATVTLGALDVTPTPAAASSASASPTIALGALSVTPTVAAASASASSPTATLGAITVTPTPAVAVAGAADPTAGSGLNVTPTSAAAAASGAAPTVTLGALVVTPMPAIGSSSASAPTIAFGGITVTPEIAAAVASASSPTVSNLAADALTRTGNTSRSRSINARSWAQPNYPTFRRRR
jgi:hypothetical protein